MTFDRYHGFCIDVFRDCVDLKRAMIGHTIPMGDTFLDALFAVMPATSDPLAIDHAALHRITRTASILPHVYGGPELPETALDAIAGLRCTLRLLQREIAAERAEMAQEGLIAA